MLDTVRIGCGAGFAGDRIDSAVDLVRDGELDDLVLECLAERTIALAQLRRSSIPPVATTLAEATISRAAPRDPTPRQPAS